MTEPLALIRSAIWRWTWGPGVDFARRGCGVRRVPSQAVEREVLEETGYVVRVGAPVVVHSFTEPRGGRGGRPFKAVRMVYSAIIVGGQLGTTEIGGSTDLAAWVPLAEIPGLESRSTILDVAYATIQQQGWCAFPASAQPDR